MHQDPEVTLHSRLRTLVVSSPTPLTRTISVISPDRSGSRSQSRFDSNECQSNSACDPSGTQQYSKYILVFPHRFVIQCSPQILATSGYMTTARWNLFYITWVRLVWALRFQIACLVACDLSSYQQITTYFDYIVLHLQTYTE
jgi:hypothetical protein